MDWRLAHIVWAYGGVVAMSLCCMWAFWKGGPTEKTGAALIAVAWILSPIVTRFDGPGPGLYVRAVDFTLFFGFVALALHSRRLWVFVTCMCILNGLVTHFVTGHKAFGMYSFVTATTFWVGYALLICLAFGIVDYRLTLRRRKLSPAPEA